MRGGGFFGKAEKYERVNKMQIIIGTLAVILSFIYCCISAVFGFLFPDAAVLEIRENLDMKIKSSAVIYHEDTHGWFGDGEEIVIFVPTEKQTEKIKSEWNKTPVENGIYSLIFSKEEYNGLELTKHIPSAKGYWFYKNRNSFADGYSYNFSFAFFDGEKVYYYELDT